MQNIYYIIFRQDLVEMRFMVLTILHVFETTIAEVQSGKFQSIMQEYYQQPGNFQSLMISREPANPFRQWQDG